MRYRVLAQLAACALLSSVATSSFATLVDFEGQGNGIPLTNGYGGLNWTSNSYVLDGSATDPGSGYFKGRVSGNYVGYSAFATDFGFATADGANFQSLSWYMMGAWRDGVSVAYTAYDGGFGGTVVASGTLSPAGPSASGPTLYTLGATGVIDAFLFVPSGGTNPGGLGGDGSHIVFDDINYSTVPEPATMAVLGLGAAALIRRRRK